MSVKKNDRDLRLSKQMVSDLVSILDELVIFIRDERRPRALKALRCLKKYLALMAFIAFCRCGELLVTLGNMVG